jgi:hypothetical protein
VVLFILFLVALAKLVSYEIFKSAPRKNAVKGKSVF